MIKPSVPYERFFTDVAEILQAGRSQAVRAVNSTMIRTYWQLGRRIVEEEQHGHARAKQRFSTHRVENLSWTHMRLIMRLENPEERHYYLQEASSQNWSSRILERHIKSGYYRRILAHQSKGTDLYRSGVLQLSAQVLRGNRPQDHETDASGYRPDGYVRADV